MNNITSLTKLHHEMIKLRERAEKAEACDRLRKKAQNEATCFALNDMLKDAQKEIDSLREENKRLNNDIVYLRQSLARYREREMTMGWNQD